ncbi:MAG TPA: hypothetical protein DCQ37_18460 [Desulfobacteraceae bacterium]|nr:hypothetical protein [Desulfobacteraceae bacterium]
MQNTELRQYIALIDAFVKGVIQPETFEKQYLEIFKNDSFRYEEEFVILDEIFADVDAFCNEPELCDDDDIDEYELRRRCVKYLGKLEIFQTEPTKQALAC